MPRIRLKIKTDPSQLAKFSTDHPEDEFTILASRSTETGLRVVLETETTDAAAIIHHFEETPEVYSFEVLEADRGSLMLQFVMPKPAPYRVGQSIGSMAKFPLILRNGWLFAEAVTSHKRLAQFTNGLETAGVQFEILSVTQSVEVTDLLTDRQWQFVTEAVERGYYNSPRGCSLVDLAAALDVSQSTASGILHRAEERIIKEFVGVSPV